MRMRIRTNLVQDKSKDTRTSQGKGRVKDEDKNKDEDKEKDMNEERDKEEDEGGFDDQVELDQAVQPQSCHLTILIWVKLFNLKLSLPLLQTQIDLVLNLRSCWWFIYLLLF